MKSALRLAKYFSIDKMTKELEIVQSSYWTPLLERAGDNSWSGVALRSYDGKITTLDYRGSFYQNTSLLDNMLYMSEIINWFKCDLKRVRLLTLYPGAFIGEHVDTLPENTERQVRLHIPIITNALVSFKVSGHEIIMNPGELWFIDVSCVHSVANKSDQSRIHLVIDCVVNEWLEQFLTNAENTVTND